MSELVKAALACGFSYAAPLKASQLEFSPQVREMCSADRCGSYGKNWCCPPACPELEEMRKIMEDYDLGVLVQTTGYLEDDFDFETMMETEKKHKANFEILVEQLGQRYSRENILPMGAGTCQRCKQCTYPDAPCRFPDKRIVSMEAYGLLVTQVCQSCGIEYYHGPGTMSYMSCILIKKEKNNYRI